jgi:hypothetical protein
MKTMYICICFGFCKHGWILFIFGMQVSIGFGIIDNENRVTPPKKNFETNIFIFRIIFILVLKCIWSAFSKHEWILLKLGVHISIGYDTIEIENRVTGKSRTWGYICGRWATE